MELFETSLISDPNLLAYYRFNSGALTTDSKNSNTLTNNNTVGETAGGIFGYGADFGAANSSKYFSISDDLGLNGQTVSIGFWFKFLDTSAKQEFFLLNDSTTNTQLYAYYESSVFYLQRYRAGVDYDTVSTAFTTDLAPHFVVCTLSNGGAGGPMELFIDNVSKGTISVPATSGTVPQPNSFQIGKGPSASYFRGYMDDFSVSNKVLSTAEMNQLYLSPGNFLAFL
jgi:hypothetical protein